MENLVPPLLTATQEIRWFISSGKSMKESVRLYLDSTNDPFAAELRGLWTLRWKSGNASTLKTSFRNHYRQALWELIERGCAGQPVLDPLCALEKEIELKAQAELDAHIATLPFKVLIPLLLFQFPAFLTLLLGPMLRDLQLHLGG